MFPSSRFQCEDDLLELSPPQGRAQNLLCASLVVSPNLGRVEQEKDPQYFGERRGLHQPPLTLPTLTDLSAVLSSETHQAHLPLPLCPCGTMDPA